MKSKGESPIETMQDNVVAAFIKMHIDDREERIFKTDMWLDETFIDEGITPSTRDLEMLADYMLYEELTDGDPYKVQREEYPILSDLQLRRRRFGRANSNMRGEISLDVVSGEQETSGQHSSELAYLAVDGKSYRYPIRRTRSLKEMMYVDKRTKIRNRARRKRYNAFIRPSKITKYNVADRPLTPSFVDCVGIADRWRKYNDSRLFT